MSIFRASVFDTGNLGKLGNVGNLANVANVANVGNVGNVGNVVNVGPAHAAATGIWPGAQGWLLNTTFLSTPPLLVIAPTVSKEAEIANIPFLAALSATLTGAMRGCASHVWLATRRSDRLALHLASAPKNRILVISASLGGASVTTHRDSSAQNPKTL